MKKIWNVFLAYGGWLSCLHFVSRGEPYWGVASVVFILLLHFWQSQLRRADLLLLLCMAFFGTLLDSSYIWLGLIHYEGEYTLWLAPLWITSLWALFSISLNHSLIWLQDVPWLTALIGASGAVASYLAAVKIGAGQFLVSPSLALTVIGAVWFFVMPALTKLASFLRLRVS